VDEQVCRPDSSATGSTLLSDRLALGLGLGADFSFEAPQGTPNKIYSDPGFSELLGFFPDSERGFYLSVLKLSAPSLQSPPSPPPHSVFSLQIGNTGN
jgi:hypothetical protein